MSPRFSIIIPVYNRPDELQELLESLRKALLGPGLSENKGKLDLQSGPDGGSDGGYHDRSDAGTNDRPDGGTNGRSDAGTNGGSDGGTNDGPDGGSDPADGKQPYQVEIIVVEDGSGISSRDVCSRYSGLLDITYMYQENAGPAAARNTGSKSAKGSWLIFFDSDCIIPEGYFDAVIAGLADGTVDFFGGPDCASEDFSPTQKAIDYAMTSFLTTGGIRGGKRKLDRYYPRSFNMGIRKTAFDDTGGFSALRFGEDLDLSMRLMSAGYRASLFREAWVYHKRRTDLKKFFKQVYNSGMARVVLNRLHPGTMKLLHLLPSGFVLYLIIALASIPFLSGLLWLPVGILVLLLFIDGFRSTGNLSSALLIPPAGFVQLCGYGTGLLHAMILVYLFKKREPRAFEKTFYK